MQQKLSSKKFFIKFFLIASITGLFLMIFLVGKKFFLVKNIIVNKNINLVGLNDLYEKNLIFLDKKFYEKSLLLKNPQIKALQIKKQLPQTLILNFEVDEIIAKIKSDQGFFYLSKEGKIIKKSKEDLNQYPLINFYKKIFFNSYQTGEKIDFIDLKKILFLINQLKEISLFPYDIDIKEDNVILFKIANKKIFFSFQKSLDLQIYQLKEIIKNLKIKGEEFKELDLRFDKPILRY